MRLEGGQGSQKNSLKKCKLGSTKPLKLRILGGKHRGRKISLPQKHIRPTKSLVRKRIFDIIMHQKKRPESFLDGFAGSGAMGLEAMSRGLSMVYFIDIDAKVIKHLEKFGSIFLGEDQIFRTIHSSITMIPRCKKPVDVVFLDPPYNRATLLKGALNTLSKRGWINSDSLVVFETSTATPIYFVEKFLRVSRHFSVGNSSIFFGHYTIVHAKLLV
jgi:16S rRNA (guanine966-N2)-methyltransferase